MNDDLIKRSDALKVAYRYCPDDDGSCSCADRDLREMLNDMEDIPSADRPQGEWIYGEHNVAMCDGYRCNRCDFFVPWDYEHKFIDFINDYHYCPSCGAKMKGADDE